MRARGRGAGDVVLKASFRKPLAKSLTEHLTDLLKDSRTRSKFAGFCLSNGLTFFQSPEG